MTDQTTLPFYDESQDALRVIKKMGQRIKELDADRQKKQAEVDDIQKEITRLSQTVLPDLMDELGIESINLDDGSKIEKSTFYTGKVPEPKWNEFARWAEETGNQALLQNEIKIKGNRQDQQAFDRARELLRESNVPFEYKAGIHHKTLQSLIKEMYEKGQPVPECIEHYVGSVVKFK